MNSKYVTLSHYNNDYDNDDYHIYDNYDFFEKNNCIIYHSSLEGYLMHPPIFSSASGNIWILIDIINQQLYFNLILRNIYQFQSCKLFIIDDNDDETEFLTLYHKSNNDLLNENIISNKLNIPHFNYFLSNLKDEKILICIETLSHPDGELAGYLKQIW